MDLYWDRSDKLHVGMTGRRPMFRILAEYEKAEQDRYLPMAPEFAESLDQTPEDERRGRVFKLASKTGSTVPMTPAWVSTELSRIGETARVKVKVASAHDLRRSFGERWSRHGLPQVLMGLMRHKNIQTMQKYYIGHNAQATADIIWAAVEGVGTFSGASPERAENAEENACE